MRPKKPYQSPFKSLTALEAYPVNPKALPTSQGAHNRFNAIKTLFPAKLLPASADTLTKPVRDKLIAYTNLNNTDIKLMQARWNAILYMDGFRDIELDSETFLPKDSGLVADSSSDLERRMAYGKGFQASLEVQAYLNDSEIQLLGFTRDVAYLIAKHYTVRQIAKITMCSVGKVQNEITSIRKLIAKNKHNLQLWIV